jgi:hypothetical protein
VLSLGSRVGCHLRQLRQQDGLTRADGARERSLAAEIRRQLAQRLRILPPHGIDIDDIDAPYVPLLLDEIDDGAVRHRRDGESRQADERSLRLERGVENGGGLREKCGAPRGNLRFLLPHLVASDELGPFTIESSPFVGRGEHGDDR